MSRAGSRSNRRQGASAYRWSLTGTSRTASGGRAGRRTIGSRRRSAGRGRSGRKMPLRIEYLVDHRDLVPVVAEWHWKDDGERTPLDFWVRAHSEESQGTKVPSCSVAFLHGRPVGCVSLIERNMDTHPELSPWLAALFVVPEVQGRGSEAPSHSTARIGL